MNFWSKALYEFTAQGFINFGRHSYNDSTCVEIYEITSPSEIPEGGEVAYIDTGAVTLQEGMEGNSIKISVSFAQLSSVDGFYTINNESLCFSEAFTFDVFTFSADEAGSTEVDFENCLTKL